MKSFLDTINKKLANQGGFLKSVGILVSGTALAQLISVIALPFLTRIYSPSEFSVFAVYFSILSILSVASCLRFEIAIPIPKKDENALSLFFLGLFSNFTITLLICLLIYFFDKEIIELLNQDKLAPYLWLIPVGVFFVGLYNLFQYWATRKIFFSVIAKTRVIQSIGGVSVQIGLGFLGFGVFGLIVGQIISYSAGTIRLFFSFLKEIKYLKNSITVKRISFNLRKYDKFPKYSTFDALANTAGIQLPIIIIAALSLGEEAAYLMLAMQVLGIPMKFIGGAISQVYLAHAPEALEQGNIRLYTISVLENLFKFSFCILIFIGIISPLLVEYIFGHEWKSVGFIISWMIPWFIFQLISSPISMIMHINHKQKLMLFLTLFGFLFKLGVLYGQYYIDSNYVLESYAIASAIFYLICYLIFSKNAKLKMIDHIYLVKKILLPGSFTVILSLFIMFFLKEVVF